jgi:hypothetical protein
VSKLVGAVKGLAPLLAVVAVVAGVVVLAMSLFGGGGDDGDDSTALALGPVESSWVSGQDSLAVYPEFAALLERARPLADERRADRERALRALERAKVAAKKNADAAARRRYEAAKRAAQLAYKQALAKAAEERRKQLQRIADARAEQRRLMREREEKLKVRPGEECGFENVSEDYDCRTGRLPDTAKPKK